MYTDIVCYVTERVAAEKAMNCLNKMSMGKVRKTSAEIMLKENTNSSKEYALENTLNIIITSTL